MTMIKNSTQLIASARDAFTRMLERCLENNRIPSYLEMYYEGYMEGFHNAKDIERNTPFPLSDWHYIEMECNPPTDDLCVILCQCDGYTEIEHGWYDQIKEQYHLEHEPRGMRKILAWHMLPLNPDECADRQRE